MASLLNKGYQTWDEFVAKAKRRLTEKECPGADDSGVTGDEEFTGTASFAEAIRMAECGWQEGAQAIASALDSLPPAEEVLPDWNLEVCGAFPCVPAYLSGDMECMFRIQDERRPERRLTLVVPGGYNCSIRASAASQYAKAVAAVIRAIEASGVSPAVYRCISATKGGGRNFVHAHAVREHGEPLDLAKIAFAFHPSMLRRLEFAWLEIDPEATAMGMSSGGYGAHLDMTTELLTAAAPHMGPHVIMPELESLYAKERQLFEPRNLPDLIANLRKHVDSKVAEGIQPC